MSLPASQTKVESANSPTEAVNFYLKYYKIIHLLLHFHLNIIESPTLIPQA